MSEYDDLERQLRGRVRELGPAPRRTRRRRRLLALIGIPVVLAGGAAAAIGIVGGTPGVQERAERLTTRAVVATFDDTACRASSRPVRSDGRLRLVDGETPAAALAVLPGLAAGSPDRLSDGEIREVLPPNPDLGAVLRSSVRVARFPDGGRAIAFVTFGSEFGPPHPAACAAARKAYVVDRRRRAGKRADDAVTRRTLYLLDHHRDTDPRSPTLWVFDAAPGEPSSGGSGSPLEPGRVVHPGLLSTGGGARGEKRFVGIAAPGATKVVVRAARGSARAASPRRAAQVARVVPVIGGLFALSEPGKGAGHLTSEHRDAGGGVLLRQPLQ